VGVDVARRATSAGASKEVPMRAIIPALFVLVFCLLPAVPSFAQNWSFDARTIGMGGVGDIGNVAVAIVDEQRPYRPIVLPFGLFQVLRDFGKFDPTSDNFDLVRAIEYAASPLHYVVGRDSTDTGSAFVTDIRNASVSRDLNNYRGFSPVTEVSAEGLSAPLWGKTFKFRQGKRGDFQGIFVGGGSYLSMHTTASIDPALASLFASDAPVYMRNANFPLRSDTDSQLAMAIAGGYRARIALPDGVGGGRPTDGLYIGANYRYLWGFGYEDFDVSARLDTDANGLLTVNPAAGFPLHLNRYSSRSGRGLAADVGVAAVVNRWDLGFGINGIANRIDWADVTQTGFFLDSLVAGDEFIELPTVSVGDRRVELPVDYRANATYNADRWTASGEFAKGFNGTTVRGGYEQRFGRIQARAGGRYVRERFEPSGGIGFNLSEGVGLDVGVFATSANFERKRHVAVAFSIRLIRGPSIP
jgi:hypothetical protein